MNAMNNKRLNIVPPDKGSFPLDHDGVCKQLKETFMNCLKKNDHKNSLCREEIRAYLECRMNNELMAKEPWSKLGFPENPEEKQTSKSVA